MSSVEGMKRARGERERERAQEGGWVTKRE